MKNSFTCLSLSSAGCVPEFGQNYFHQCQGKRVYGVSYFCAKSETAVGVAGGGKDFAALHWNRKHGGNKIDAPEGWGWAELRFEHSFMGGKTMKHKDFIGFKIDHNPDKSFEIHFFDLTTQKISTICVPKFKGYPPISIDVSKAWCTDNTRWPIMHIYATNSKWFSTFQKILFPSD